MDITYAVLVPFAAEEDRNFIRGGSNGLAVALHLVITEDLKQEGIVREVVRAVQDARKRLDLPVEKYIDLVLDAEGEVKAALERFESVLRDNVLLGSLRYGTEEEMEYVTIAGSRVGIRIR